MAASLPDLAGEPAPRSRARRCGVLADIRASALQIESLEDDLWHERANLERLKSEARRAGISKSDIDRAEDSAFDPSDDADELTPILSDLRGGAAAAEIAARLRSSMCPEDIDRTLASEAADLLDAGLIGDAERRLECAVTPKFASLADCRAAYDIAMGAQA